MDKKELNHRVKAAIGACIVTTSLLDRVNVDEYSELLTRSLDRIMSLISEYEKEMMNDMKIKIWIAVRRAQREEADPRRQVFFLKDLLIADLIKKVEEKE